MKLFSDICEKNGVLTQTERKRSVQRTLLRSILTGLTTLGLVGCLSSGSDYLKELNAKYDKAEDFAELMSAPGTTYKVAKTITKRKGYVVLQNMETGEYIAYNVDKWDEDNMKSADAYLAAIDVGSDIVGDLEKNVHTYEEWVTKYEITTESRYEKVAIYDAEGLFSHYDWEWVDYEISTPYEVLETKTSVTYRRGNFIFQHNSQMQKDLETLGSMLQGEQIDKMSGQLVENFGLNTDRAHTVARKIASFGELSRSRNLSKEDYKALYTDLLGVDSEEFLKAQAAAAGGSKDRLDELIKQAANKNAISPEQIRNIMGRFQ